MFYRLAGIAFIGGSLTHKGGHNPLEAALLDCAILHGPDMSNCAAVTETLARAKATIVVDNAERASPRPWAACSTIRWSARRARRRRPASPPTTAPCSTR